MSILGFPPLPSSANNLNRTVEESPSYQLISATPSPYARKVRIALAEKGLPFELLTEVAWDSTTRTPRYNPLEKLPIRTCLGACSTPTWRQSVTGRRSGSRSRTRCQRPRRVLTRWYESC